MRSSLVRMRSNLERMRSSLERMRSSLVVRASDCQCTSCNGPGFGTGTSIRRHSGICGAADAAVLNLVRKKNKPAFLTNDLLSDRSSPRLGRPGRRLTSMSRSVMSWLTSSPNSVSNMLMDFSTFAGWDRPGMKFSLKKEKISVVNEHRYWSVLSTGRFAL